MGLNSVDLTDAAGIAAYDAVLVVTAHSDVDYPAVVEQAQLVVDLRNATAGITGARQRLEAVTAGCPVAADRRRAVAGGCRRGEDR